MDPSDTPSLGIQKKANYVNTINREMNLDHWIWLTGDSLNIEKITDAVGYKFKREGKDFHSRSCHYGTKS